MAALPNPALGPRFLSALELAHELHAGQVRKGKGVSYLGHLLGVASIVIDAGGSEDEAIAALLHDAAEDQGGLETLARIRAQFGTEVADIVEACSDTFESPKPPWRERKDAYLAHLETASDSAVMVSLADKVQNAQAILLDHGELGDEMFDRFKAGKDATIAYYAKLAEVLSRRRPGPLSDQLSATIEQLKRQTGAPG